MAPPSNAYEQHRAAQVAKNRALLHELGLPSITAAIKQTVAAATPPPKKRKAPSTTSSDSTPPALKARRGLSSSSDGGSPTARRSSRITEKLAREEAGEDFESSLEYPNGLAYDSDSDGERAEGKQRRSPTLNKKERPNPKIFGSQKLTPVGKTWDFRIACSQDGIHAPVVAGISGNEHVGVWSVALSGGYEDDIDLGYAFTYTGSGGRDLKGTKAAPKNLRTAPQSSDQTFTAVNAALKKSVDTQKPIRVVRGFKGKSCFAPETGYRYDGLYLCTKAWMDVGESGFKVCRFSFIRMPGQPAIPVQEGREEEAEGIIADFGDAEFVSLPKKKRSAK
ncbi:hypothetical protein P7C70_g6486, partial [Phenoliferia sp. Uapishka_3]